MSIRHRRRDQRRRVHLEHLAPVVATQAPPSLELVTAYGDLQERTPDGRFVCQACGRTVPLLVDDGPLCVRCDLLHYPFEPPTRRVA